MSWLKSNAIRYLFFTWLGGTLLQLVPMMQARNIDWWALGTQAVATLAGIITRMAQSDVQAPAVLGFLNKPVPPA